MQQYLDYLRDIRENGTPKTDRTGTGTLSCFGRQMRFDISGHKFPLLTTKKCHLKSIIHELLWFIKGEGTVDYLAEQGVTIWDEWIKPNTAIHAELDLGQRLELVKDEKHQADFNAYRDTMYRSATLPETVNLDEWTPIRDGTMYRRKDINERLHAKLDEYTIPRTKLVAGDLGPVYGTQWRQWPVTKRMVPLSAKGLERRLKGLGLLDTLIARMDQEEGLGSYWVWSTVNQHARVVGVDTPVISQFLKEHAISDTEEITLEGIDQLQNVISRLKTNPDDRRLLVSAWNPAEIGDMALPPCHMFFQFWTRPLTHSELVDVIFRSTLLRLADIELLGMPEDDLVDVDKAVYLELDPVVLKGWVVAKGLPIRGVSCQFYMRSIDSFLGLPFNIASYALLTKMVAQVVNMEPLELIWTGGDCHIYSNHLDQVDEQLSREPLPGPVMLINRNVKDIDAFCYEDFTLAYYESHPAIKAPIAV